MNPGLPTAAPIVRPRITVVAVWCADDTTLQEWLGSLVHVERVENVEVLVVARAGAAAVLGAWPALPGLRHVPASMDEPEGALRRAAVVVATGDIIAFTSARENNFADRLGALLREVESCFR